MNASYNYSDFIGLSLESSDDYEPYGYDMETLATVEAVQTHGTEQSIESIIFARGLNRSYVD